MSIIPSQENCYICLSNDNKGDECLIESPCSCKMHIHAKCLHKYIEMSRKVACTICRNVYSISLINDDRIDCQDLCNLITSIKDAKIKRVSSDAFIFTSNITDSNDSRVRVFAHNYNILRIMSGMGGIAYSN